ncbi:MAG: hypothetical protein GY757_38645 [bacterium]|nr:hypothetical protein [bacterium]
MKTRINSTGEVHHSGPGTASIKRIVFLFVFLVSLSVFSDKLNAEYNLEFDSIDCPKQIVIPHPVPENVENTFAKCKINYTYHGTLISEGKLGGYGSSYDIERNYLIHATIIYLDKKNSALMVLNKPEEGEIHYSSDTYILGVSAIFMDKERYTADLFFLDSHPLNQKK